MSNYEKLAIRAEHYRARVHCLETAEVRNLDLITTYRRKLAQLDSELVRLKGAA